MCPSKGDNSTFNVSSVNSAPTAVVDTVNATEAGGAANATAGTNPTGNVLTNDTDPDSSDGKTVLNAKSAAASDTSVGTNTSITGVYGTLVISTDGSYTYTVNNANAAVEALRVTANTLTDTFNYTMKDTAGLKSSSTLTVTVQGANDTPDANNDSNVAKESIVTTVANQYLTTDITGYKATGNVLSNDTDVDSAANGETKTVAGLSGSASANVVASANVSSKLVFNAATTLSPVSAGDYLYVNVGTNDFRALLNANGNHLTVVTKTDLGSGSYEFVLSGTPDKYYDAAGNVSITSLNTKIIGFNSSSANTNNGGGGTKTATVSSSSATGNSTATLTSIAGTVAAGMSVTGTGIPSGTTIKSIAYDGSGNPTLTFSAIVTATNGTALTFTAAVDTTLTGRYGDLTLAANGAYTYTPKANNADLSEGGSGTDSFTYRLNDASSAEDTAVLTINVQGSGTNDPDANADVATAVEAVGISNATTGTNPTGNVLTNDTTPSSTGTLSVSKAALSGGSEATVSTNTAITGSYGTLTISSDGSYSYAVNNSNNTVNALRTSSDTLTEIFTYRIVNSASAKEAVTTLTITIQGGNDTPTAVADTTSAYEASGIANATLGSNPSGNLLSNDTDVDTGDGKSVSAFSTSGGSTGTVDGSTALSGTYGTLTVATNGSYTYTVNNSNTMVQALAPGGTVSESFNYTVKDTAAATANSILTVTVNGANDAPVNTVPGTNPSVSEAGTVTISGVSVADADSTSLTVTLTVLNGTMVVTPNGGAAGISNSGTTNVTITGTPAAINTALGTLSYTGATDFNGTDTLKIVSTDGSLTDTDTRDITVTADNRSLSVTGTTVNEASPYALFQVTGAASQKVSLTLGSTASTGDTDTSSGTDFLPNMQYYSGSNWVTYSGGLVSIPSGGTTMLVRVPVLNDNADEPDETFTLTATNKAGTGSTPGISTIVDTGNGVVFLAANTSFTANSSDNTGYPATLDDDRALTVNNISVNEDSTHAVFQVGGTANQAITLAQAVGSATADTDYGSTLQVWNGTAWSNYGSSVTIPTGGVLLARSTATDDATYEGAETFGLRATNGGGVGYTSTATILDDGTGLVYDGTVTSNAATTSSAGLDNDLSVSVSASTPVNEKSTYAMFSITATAGSALTLAVAGSGTTQATTSSFTMQFSTDAGSNWITYSASSTPLVAGTLGSGTGTVAVRVLISSEQDTQFEGAETFSLTATMAAGGNSPLSAAAVATIVDNGTGASYDGTLSNGTPNSSTTSLDNDTPTAGLTLTGTTLNTSEAATQASFTVKLSSQPTADVTVTLTGLDATEGSLDKTTLTFTNANWNSAQTVTVTGADDTLDDGNIAYTLTATTSSTGDANYNAGNAKTGTVSVTNADDDAAPTLSINDATIDENAGTASFTVTRSGATGGTTTVNYATADGTATAGSDYTAKTGLLGFAPGETSKTISVSISDDGVVEGREAFTVGLSNITDASSSAESISDNNGGGTINDNDLGSISSIGANSVTEGGMLRFTVVLSVAASSAQSYAPQLSGTANELDYGTVEFSNGVTYDPASGMLVVPAAVTKFSVNVPTIDDFKVEEGGETLVLTLGGLAGTGSILDNDERPATPIITDVTETGTDPTPFDLLTMDVTQLIQVSGTPDHTIRLYTVDNVLIAPSNYTVTEKSPGSYEIDARRINLQVGDYVVRQVDAYGNESLNSNEFTIDSIPEVQDNTSARALLPETGMTGALSVIDQNRLDLTNLQTANPPTHWYDSDGEDAVFGIAGVQAINNIDTLTLASGSKLTLNTIDGSYIYNPSANAVFDIFPITVRDPGNKGGNLNLSFEVRDLLDRDGIPGGTEDALAILITGGQKDLNSDGVDDSVQNSVTTLAWGKQGNFATAVAGNFADVARSSIITIIANESSEGTVPSPITQLIGIEVLKLGDGGNGSISTNGLDGIETPWDPILFSIEPLQSLGLIDTDNTRSGLQARVTIDITAAATPVGGFNGYMKYISADVISAASAAGIVLTTLDGETLSDISQAGWYDFMQRTPSGDGARFITQNGMITSIEIILTDNAFGDVDFALGRLTDPGMPVADVLKAKPIYAAEVGQNDHYLSGLSSDAQAHQLIVTDPVRIEFFTLPTEQADALPLKAWLNYITGDYFYAPEGTPPPYDCYFPVNGNSLGYVQQAGQGAFDVHLFMNSRGITQIMGLETADNLGLATSGYLDYGVLFASSVALDTPVEPIGVSDQSSAALLT